MKTKHQKSFNIFTEVIKGTIKNEYDLKSKYRSLAKKYHPDIPGGTKEAFSELKKEFELALAFLKSMDADNNDFFFDEAASFDPDKFLEEEGYSSGIPSRLALYVALNRYYSIGLYSFKTRNKASMQKSYAKITKAIQFWAIQYDNEFMSLFNAFNNEEFIPFSEEILNKKLIHARNAFINALGWFFEYQFTGRKTAYTMAMEQCNSVIIKLDDHSGIKSKKTLIDFANWLLQELTKKPAHDL